MARSYSNGLGNYIVETGTRSYANGAGEYVAETTSVAGGPTIVQRRTIGPRVGSRQQYGFVSLPRWLARFERD